MGQHFVERDQVRAEGEERGVVLDPREIARVLQQHRLGRLIEHRHDARHMGHRVLDGDLVAGTSDHQTQLCFRGHLADTRRDDDRLTGADDGGRP